MKSKVVLFFIILASLTLAQSPPYVILISFDGFRWDYSERGIAPNLEKMKREGVHALSLRPSFPSKTFPNHYSIVTGMYPENHGLISNSFTDPFTKEKYKISDKKVVGESKWYLGEAFWEIAKRNGIICASYFWPGSEIMLDYRRPKYYEKYEHKRPYKQRIDGVINWLKLPEEERPHFITLYFDDTDTYGHRYGPNSPEINQSIQRLDSLIGYLYKGLNTIGMMDSTNVILVSDHGMTDISLDKVVNIEEMLIDFEYEIGGDKPFMMIEPSKSDFQNVYKTLKENENYYKVYLKEDLPDNFHYSKHPFIYSIILIADIGWSLVNNAWLKDMNNSYSKGNHGYDNNQRDMHGVFIARGPNIKSNYKTGTIWNVDIYPMLSKIFNIESRSNIDGKLERIEFILK
jgi:ectonucleotide pyrophosphatase/phosphodiesterase family member 5